MTSTARAKPDAISGDQNLHHSSGHHLTPFCACCGGQKHLQVHHIIPFRLTRDNSRTNLIPLCRACHKRVEAVFQDVEAAGPPIPITKLVLFCSIHATRTVTLHKLKGLKSNADQHAAA